MKIFSIAVAVSLVLACVHFLESSAVPFSEVQMEEIEKIDSPVTGHEQTGGSSNNLPTNMDHSQDMDLPLRVKRQSHLSLCRWCCNCCYNKGCGFCCKF